MSEMEVLIAGFVGGAVAASIMGLVFYSHVKMVFEERLRTLQFQLTALRVEINSGYDK
jgi:energy-converting hydrogenase Eha subunit G